MSCSYPFLAVGNIALFSQNQGKNCVINRIIVSEGVCQIWKQDLTMIYVWFNLLGHQDA